MRFSSSRSSRRRSPVGVLLLTLAYTGCAPKQAPPRQELVERPNIIFIFSDDHAAQAVGAYGSTINQTPNLDRLAREGVLFRNAFVTNAICGPRETGHMWLISEFRTRRVPSPKKGSQIWSMYPSWNAAK